MGTLARYLLVAAGGALGSCARYWVGSAIASRFGPGFPWGTLVVNVSGSFVLGGFMAVALGATPIDPRTRLLVAVGFCGGYTTFSTFAWETVGLVEARDLVLAAVNVAASAVAGMLAIVGGAAFGRWLG